MCGRYASSRRDIELTSELQVDSVVGEELPASWNVAPTQPARVVLERIGDGPVTRPERQLRSLTWGLIPSWATDPRVGARLINAREETVTTRRAYRVAASLRRCLVVADGYYEWERRAAGEGTVPHFLHDGGRLLTFAGLYELWTDPALPADDPERWVRSFTIVTTTAPDALGHIHDRSPVVIPPALRDDWLDPSVTRHDDVRQLLDAAPTPVFSAYQVSTAVNNHRNDGPRLVEPIGSG